MDCRKASRILADRRDPEVILPLRRLILETPDDHLCSEALWALNVSGGLSDEFASSLLDHRNEDVRWWTVRLLGDEVHVAPAIGAKLARMAASDPSVAVRVQLACTAKRLPAATALAILEPLVKHNEDASDPYLPLLLWWAVERHAVTARESVLARSRGQTSGRCRWCTTRSWSALMRRYAAEATAHGDRACARLLAAGVERGDRTTMLAVLIWDSKIAASSKAAALARCSPIWRSPSSRSTVERPKIARTTNVAPEITDAIVREWEDDTTDMTLMRVAAQSANLAPASARWSCARPDASVILASGRRPTAGRAGWKRDRHVAVAARGGKRATTVAVGGPRCARPLR